MEVYKFDKSLLDRLEESMSVLSWKDQAIPASQVRVEWSCFIELQIEPAGWQALWKIPRVICEELHVRYPTMVFGCVEQVLFKELKAIFIVEAVQDDDVHLPERHEVALEDLWPTKAQENSVLNVERTADCLDRLRFFYAHVWMPWDTDNDDDLDWVEKHLEARIRFCYDLRKRSIKRALAAHIRTLLTEAKYIQQRREYLELGLSDDDELDETLDKTQITDLMRMHLRLAMIRGEIEMLENPEMRHIYEEIKFDDEKHLKDAKHAINMQEQLQRKTAMPTTSNYYIVLRPCTLAKQMELLRLAQQRIPADCQVPAYPALQDVLSVCNASDNILLSPGQHTIKFLEYLNDNGSITGLVDSKSKSLDSEQNVIITSADDDSMLLVFDGHFTLENLVLDCQNVRTGVMVKNGKVRLRNCRLVGNGESSTQQGILCSGSAQLHLENCSIENFATGIILNEGTSVQLSNSNITNCPIGLDLGANNTAAILKNACIRGSKKCGIYVDSLVLDGVDSKSLTLARFNELEKYANSSSIWSGDCAFKDCKANICILNHSKLLFSKQTLKSMLGDNEVNQTQDIMTTSATAMTTERDSNLMNTSN